MRFYMLVVHLRPGHERFHGSGPWSFLAFIVVLAHCFYLRTTILQPECYPVDITNGALPDGPEVIVPLIIDACPARNPSSWYLTK